MLIRLLSNTKRILRKKMKDLLNKISFQKSNQKEPSKAREIT
jgi:hypothetical protein